MSLGMITGRVSYHFNGQEVVQETSFIYEVVDEGELDARVSIVGIGSESFSAWLNRDEIHELVEYYGGIGIRRILKKQGVLIFNHTWCFQ